jgi:hypothetical protein
MAHIKLLTVFLFTLLLIASCSKDGSYTEKVESLNLAQVRQYARSHFLDTIPEHSRVEIFSDFDFHNFEPLKESKNKEYKVTVYYNDENKIIKLTRASTLPDNDYEFRVIRNEKMHYLILYAEEFYEHSESEYIYSFFLVYKNECYFISFESPLCVMQLDSHLRAMNTLRFNTNRLAYRTMINYKDSIHLYSESFFKPVVDILINDSTTVDDVTRHFSDTEKFVFEKELVIGLLKEYDHLPLWRFEGHHEYDTQAIP